MVVTVESALQYGKKTEEVIFSTKRYAPLHVPLQLGNFDIDRKLEHKHIGMVLDSKLNFQSHIREAILKASRGIGIIRHISKYVSRNVLDQIYKLYVRPHFDYGDIIYHRYDPDMRLNINVREYPMRVAPHAQQHRMFEKLLI